VRKKGEGESLEQKIRRDCSPRQILLVCLSIK